MRYLANHWFGRQPFIWSFWVNLVAVRVILYFVKPFFQHPFLVKSEFSASITIGFAVVANGIIFGWQIVGLLRSGSLYLRKYGSMAAVWGAQLTVIFFIWHAISSLLDGWYSTLPEEELFTTRMDREHASKYKISFLRPKMALSFDGSIELGSTKRMAEFLDAHSPIKTLIINSNGGNVYEARGIARLIKQNDINTVVVKNCNSACLTIFIAGSSRSISPGARLGFHQYRLDVDYQVPNVNRK